jgi:gas vesicle protein
MANEYDYESTGGGSGFVMGLLTGTVLGAGLGMLFAPKSGTELRGRLSESASHVGERGRDMVNRARDAVSRGTEEARRYAEKGSQAIGSSGSGSSGSHGGSTGSSGTSGSPYSSDPSRG